MNITIILTKQDFFMFNQSVISMLNLSKEMHIQREKL